MHGRATCTAFAYEVFCFLRVYLKMSKMLPVWDFSFSLFLEVDSSQTSSNKSLAGKILGSSGILGNPVREKKCPKRSEGDTNP